jgi:hypothetical protein
MISPFDTNLLTHSLDLTSGQRTLVISLACTIIFAVPALILYIIFKCKAIKNAPPAVQETSQEVNKVSQGVFPKAKQEPSPPPSPALSSSEDVKATEQLLNQFQEELKNIEKKMRDGTFSLYEQAILEESGIVNLLKEFCREEQTAKKAEIKQRLLALTYERQKPHRHTIVKPKVLEEEVLKSLGFHISDSSTYHNKELIWDLALNRAQEKFKSDNTKVEEVKKVLIKLSLHVRLEQLGITDATVVQNIETLLVFGNHIISLSWAKEGDKELQFPDHFPKKDCPKTVQDLKAAFLSQKRRIAKQKLIQCIQDQIKAELNLDKEAFKKFLKSTSLKQSILNAWHDPDFGKSLLPKMDFYNEFGTHLALEFMQGSEDPNEALTEGVCWALVHRIMGQSQQKPNEDEASLTIGITPGDRVVQARYKQTKEHWKYSPKEFDKDREKELLCSKEKSEWIHGIDSFKDELQPSKGWMLLGLYFEDSTAHAIGLRVDHTRNKLWLWDPNIGFFKFEAHETSFGENKKRLLSCLSSLISTFYSDTTWMRIQQKILKAT